MTGSAPSAPDFGGAVELLEASAAPDPGSLYRALLLAETHPNYLRSAWCFAAAQLEGAEAPDALIPRARDRRNLADWIVRLEAWARSDLDSAGYPPLRTARERALLLKHFAPAALVEGCWLEGATGLAAAEQTLGLLCQEQFRLRASGDSSRALFGAPARALVREALGQEVEAWQYAFVSGFGIAPHAFEHALAGLCLARFAASLMPEVAGFELWQACTGSCPPLIRAGEDSAPVTGRLVRQARDILREAVLGPNSAEDSMDRALSGFATAHQSYRRWRSAIEALRDRSGPADRMLALLEAKARHAVGHHEWVSIGGLSLDSYFSRGTEGCRELLPALAASDYVRPSRPEWSRLLTSATRVRGCMFGVFDAWEVATIEAWVRETADGATAGPSAGELPPLAGTYVPPQDPERLETAAAERFADLDPAELSYHLLNADRFPVVRPYSRRVAADYARLFARLGEKAAPGCPGYAVGSLDALADGSRLNPASAARSDDPPRLGSDGGSGAVGADYPSMCTQGSWLQGSAQAARMHRPFNLLMFDAYRVLNGGGDPSHNQNRAARRLLASIGAVLAPTSDPSFYRPAELEADFFLLCGNLAFSLNPLTFMPELLGLNLAMETGAAGLRYSRTAAGPDGSVDDRGTRHSMASRRAIANYLDHASGLDPEGVQGLWERIWNAYHAARTLADRREDPEVRSAIDDLFGARSGHNAGDIGRGSEAVARIGSGTPGGACRPAREGVD